MATPANPRICVFTHRDPDVVGSAGIDRLVAAAHQHGVTLLAGEEEHDKHPGLAGAAEAARELGWPDCAQAADAAIVLAGDGTLLRVLAQLRNGPPVLGINYGVLGYLSGSSHEHIGEAVGALASGAFRTVDLPFLETSVGDRDVLALNDIVASGGVTGRIIELGWRIVTPASGDAPEQVDQMGAVPCDGMVLATAVGSTAYNLSNGGPVMAWGCPGYVVSFIAPHTLSARPLVVAPGDLVEIEHLGRGAPLKVFADGRSAGKLQPGDRLRVRVSKSQAKLALVEPKTFYARYRDSFAAQIQTFDRARIRTDSPTDEDRAGAS